MFMGLGIRLLSQIARVKSVHGPGDKAIITNS